MTAAKYKKADLEARGPSMRVAELDCGVRIQASLLPGWLRKRNYSRW
jgi:hypothetical protein